MPEGQAGVSMATPEPRGSLDADPGTTSELLVIRPDERTYGRAIWQSWRRLCFGITKRPLLHPGDIL